MILFSSVIPLKFGTLWATTEDTLEAKMLLIPRPKAMIFEKLGALQGSGLTGQTLQLQARQQLSVVLGRRGSGLQNEG